MGIDKMTTNTLVNLYSSPCAAMELPSPVGTLYLAASEHGLTHLTCEKNRISELASVEFKAKVKAEAVLKQVKQQLEEYFAKKRSDFSVPLAPKGTEFQHQVWDALMNTRHGETLSYSDIANEIGRPKAVRAVGAANGANHIAIIIPCHRIIGKSGKLTGYAYGLEMKQHLLNLENPQKQLV
ncbi:cysteine methyltransferase [Shewanella sp. OPT22]|nr:cysteine methyltransferase [Shewanella sp. OPT22]